MHLARKPDGPDRAPGRSGLRPQLGHGIRDGTPPVIGILLGPERLRPRRGDGDRGRRKAVLVVVDKQGLDGGRPDVDAKKHWGRR